MNLDREWEKFAGGATVGMKERLHVTLNSKGIILLNKNAYRLFGSPPAVNLHFNRQRDTIAVEPTHARHLIFPVKQRFNYYVIHALPFCKHFGIKVPGTQCFIRPDINEKGLLLLDLSNTANVGGWRRKQIRD